MRSREPLRDWMRHLLPHAGRCAQEAARQLVVALMLEFTTVLTQLGRQSDRDTTAKSARQFFARWLSRPAWEPAAI